MRGGTSFAGSETTYFADGFHVRVQESGGETAITVERDGVLLAERIGPDEIAGLPAKARPLAARSEKQPDRKAPCWSRPATKEPRSSSRSGRSAATTHRTSTSGCADSARWAQEVACASRDRASPGSDGRSPAGTIGRWGRCVGPARRRGGRRFSGVEPDAGGGAPGARPFLAAPGRRRPGARISPSPTSCTCRASSTGRGRCGCWSSPTTRAPPRTTSRPTGKRRTGS